MSKYAKKELDAMLSSSDEEEQRIVHKKEVKQQKKKKAKEKKAGNLSVYIGNKRKRLEKSLDKAQTMEGKIKVNRHPAKYQGKTGLDMKASTMEDEKKARSQKMQAKVVHARKAKKSEAVRHSKASPPAFLNKKASHTNDIFNKKDFEKDEDARLKKGPAKVVVSKNTIVQKEDLDDDDEEDGSSTKPAKAVFGRKTKTTRLQLGSSFNSIMDQLEAKLKDQLNTEDNYYQSQLRSQLIDELLTWICEQYKDNLHGYSSMKDNEEIINIEVKKNIKLKNGDEIDNKQFQGMLESMRKVKHGPNSTRHLTQKPIPFNVEEIGDDEAIDSCDSC